MLNPEVFVNLSPKLGVSVDLVRRAIGLVKNLTVGWTVSLACLAGEFALSKD